MKEANLTGMDRRARMAEVVLALVIICILNCACVAYCKLTNKQKNVQNMQLAVNEQVSQYFALAQDEQQAQRMNRSSESQN